MMTQCDGKWEKGCGEHANVPGTWKTQTQTKHKDTETMQKHTVILICDKINSFPHGSAQAKRTV